MWINWERQREQTESKDKEQRQRLKTENKDREKRQTGNLGHTGKLGKKEKHQKTKLEH